MSKSLEHSPKFHMVRRIAKVIAPDFRILARSDFHRQQSCLDLHEKTIEVSETASEFEMVGYVLFHLGHLRLMGQKKFESHFGSIQDQDEKALVAKLSKQGTDADHKAYQWAIDVFMGNFNVSPERAHAIISGQIWNESEWTEYYLAQNADSSIRNI